MLNQPMVVHWHMRVECHYAAASVQLVVEEEECEHFDEVDILQIITTDIHNDINRSYHY